MIGIKVKGKGIMGVELKMVEGQYKYFFPTLETLKYRKTLTIQPSVLGFITPSLIPTFSFLNAKLTLKNKKGIFIIREMPLATINFAYERGFLINDEIDFQNSFIEFPNNAVFGSTSIYLNIVHTDEKSDIRYGYIAETITVPNSGVWQSLALFTKLDDTYPVIALDPTVRSTGANGISMSLLLKDTSGVIILDKVDDQIFIPQSRITTSYTRLSDDFDRLNATHFDFKTSEIFCAAAAPTTNISYTLGLYYRRK